MALQDHFERMTKRETSAKNRPNSRAARPRSAERGQLPAEVRLHQDLVGAIIDQRLPAGTRLNEANLAKAYRLARPRVRNVLSRLAANNIIELKLNFGAFVRRPSPEEARNVYQARRFLEAGLIQSIAENPAGYNLAPLRELVAAEKRAYRNPKLVQVVNFILSLRRLLAIKPFEKYSFGSSTTVVLYNLFTCHPLDSLALSTTMRS